MEEVLSNSIWYLGVFWRHGEEERERECKSSVGTIMTAKKRQDRTILMWSICRNYSRQKAGQDGASDKKRAPGQKKSVLLISLYLWNYLSNFKIIKSLTQLCKWATQIYHQKQHIAYVPLMRSPQKANFSGN